MSSGMAAMHRARVTLRSTAAAWAILFICIAPTARAQASGGGAARVAAGVGEIRGRLVEMGSGRAIAGGSITVRRAADTSFAGGALPRADGSFQVDGLAAGRYTVRVRALGYAPLVRSDVTISADRPLVDLGPITLSLVATKLEGQVVTAEREDVALAPDRNSYSTKNMTTASGGTAVDVLRNVPSVEIDGSNNVSLRGNANVVVQINGRSSPLKGEQLGHFLTQLPASTVTRVEVATNPSAKNDPEGTAGIINIVLNQDAELGLSGGITAGTGTTRQANVSGNIGRQSGPLTLFLSGSIYRDHRTFDGFSDRTNLLIPVPAFVESRSDGKMQPRFQNMTFRSEYRFTEHDALSADAMLSGGRFARQSAASYTNLNAARDVIGLFDQFNDAVSRSISQDYTVAFRRTQGSSTPVFSTELRYSDNDWTNDVELFGVLRQADASTGSRMPPREHDVSAQRMPTWNLQSDFTHPFGSSTKLETGFKGTLRTNANDFTAAYLDSATGVYVPAASRASSFDYHERIGAVYGVLSRQVGQVQTQGGLRLEESRTRFTLPSVSQEFTNRYASAFPSAIVSYNLTDMRQVKLSYSRRVSRPHPSQLSPIPYREDSRHEFRGNPALRPEYTDAIELGLQEARAWGSVQLNPYLRKTAHAVRYIQLVDTAGVTVSTFDNVASTQTAGADLNVNYRNGPLSFFGGGSAWRYTSDAANLAVGNLSTRATVWSLRSNVTWKFSTLTDGQLFVNYRAPSATEGGTQSAFVFMNMGLRHKLWADQGSVSLRFNDPFNMMKFGFRTADGRVIELSERHFGQRGLFITISRNFGQQLKLQPRQQDPEPQASPQPSGP
jgi:outer membrane receptor protein involved in Fe transport